MKIVDLVTLGAISHAELNAEIDAETDEQDGEGHRDQVERTHHGQTDRGGDREADQQADEDCQNDSRTTARRATGWSAR